MFEPNSFIWLELNVPLMGNTNLELNVTICDEILLSYNSTILPCPNLVTYIIYNLLESPYPNCFLSY